MALSQGTQMAMGNAASGLFSIFNQIYQRGTDKKNIERQNRANMELARYTYKQDLDMWNRQNLYNSPGQQMERLKAAGLNPNLVYGNGVTGNTVGAGPRFPTPDINARVPALNPMEMLNNYMDIRMKQAQINNVEAQRRIADQELIVRAAKAKAADSYWFGLGANQVNRAYSSEVDLMFKKAAQNAMFRQSGGMFFPSDQLTNSIQAQYARNVAMLNKYNAEVALKNVQNDINQLNLKYMKWGSPVWSPLINALGGIGRTALLKK